MEVNPMPDTPKYYPVLVRIVSLLQGLPLTTFRAAVVARTTNDGQLQMDERLLYRFVMGYKGRDFSCGEDHVTGYRRLALDYLSSKMDKAIGYGRKALEPVVEIEIDLRDVQPRQLPA